MTRSSLVALDLGTTLLEREVWDYFRSRGYSRDDIRRLIVDNGIDSLISYMSTGDIDDLNSDGEFEE